jgi:beta-glucosidase
VGYRGHEIKNVAPLFPFGYGRSYSTFKYSNLSVSSIAADGTFTVKFEIKNISSIDGREVAQIYISDDTSSLSRPVKELKGFTKVSLRGGETKAVQVDLDREALGFYDERRAAWVAEAGMFNVLVGTSSAEILLKDVTTLEKSFTWTGL